MSLLVHVLDSACGGDAVPLGVVARFTTNRAGNGRADHVFTPADATGFQSTHGVVWEVTNGTETYRSDGEEVTLD